MKNKNRKIFACITAFLLLFTGCGKGPGVQQKDDGGLFEDKEYTGEINPGGSAVKVYADKHIGEDYKTVAYKETNNLCAKNEGQGWTILEEPLLGGLPSVGYKGTFPEAKCISLSTGWSCFEREPGMLDWTVMDETIEYWVSQGKMINMRLCTDGLDLNQGVINGCPEWIFHEPYNVPKIINGGSIYADLSSRVYQTELRRFLTEFASHYTSESYPYRDAIEVVELRGYGMVGEWHSGWNTYNSVEERTKTLCDTIDIWREAWGDKLLVLSCTYEFLNSMWGVNSPRTYEEFMYWMGYDHAMKLDNITFRRDGIAFALQKFDSRFGNDYFFLNTGLPLFGELGGGYHTHGDDDPYPLFEALNEALHKWRVNYNTVVGWVAQDFSTVIEKEKELVEYFNRLMGFRFVPDRVQYSSSVKAGSRLYLNTLWSNKAMGRCRYDYDLSIYLEDKDGKAVYCGTDRSFDSVSVNGGEPHFFNLSYDLPASLKKGRYVIKFAVTDENGIPRAELPIAGNDGSNRYYLGEVTVGDKEAKNLIECDSLDGNTSFKAEGKGKITSRLVNVDGTKAIVGSLDGVYAKGNRLENGSTYYVTFSYKTDKDREDIRINDQGQYIVGAYSSEKGWGDCYKWNDVSNLVSHRSATIKVPDDGNEYRLAFGGENGVAPIAADNISVVKAHALDSSFRINPNYTENKGGGVYEIKSSVTQNWAEGLQLKNRLQSHATYMISFDAATAAEVSGGGFFYVTLTHPGMDPESGKRYIAEYSLTRIGSFWTPRDRGYRKYSYVFNTGDYGDGWQLVFGVRNMGAVSLKNIVLTKIDSDFTYASDKEVIEHNVIPDKKIDVDRGPVAENFESGAFNGTCMYPGMSTGVIRRGKHVISGNYSCYIENTDPRARFYEWNVFCQTNLADMKFSPNTAYRVKFKFMVIDDVRKEDSGYFYSLAREEGYFTRDRGVFEWKTGYEVGEVYSVEYEFTTGDSDRYYFMWGVHWHGSLAIDDVVFEKVNSPTGQTAPVVTKGHAYGVTEDVLYRR